MHFLSCIVLDSNLQKRSTEDQFLIGNARLIAKVKVDQGKGVVGIWNYIEY